MLINNVHITGNGEEPQQIEIDDSIIKGVYTASNNFIEKAGTAKLNFENAIAFPGLINSHDHLEFNLFPKLGSKPVFSTDKPTPQSDLPASEAGKFYNDYVEWGNDIHNSYKDQIERVKKIPSKLRFKWGLYKNLLCGVTTVVHHGNGAVFRFENLPEVYTNYNYLHSVRLEKKWRIKLNLIFNTLPFAIHVGEGTNPESAREIDELIKWNIFRKKLIGVHGISLNEKQSGNFRAVVWCPDSNLFLYNKTADIQKLKKHTKIVFGTDSTLSSEWNIWNHLRSARKLNYLNDEELYKSLTETASEIWRLGLSGKISANRKADIVVAKEKSGNLWESFYSIDPEDILLIIKNGKIVFMDERLQIEQPVINEKDFDIISINSVHKYMTKGIYDLMLSIKNYIPEYNFPIQQVD